MAPLLEPDDSLLKLLETGSDEEIVLVLASFDTQEVADLLEDAPEALREKALDALGLRKRAQVLREFEDEDVLEDVLEEMPDAEIADVAEVMRTDDAVDLIQDLPEERQERVLQEIDPEQRAEIRRLHRYDPETAGGLMQTELISVHEDVTVNEATETVRDEYRREMGALNDIYVVDDARRIRGRVRSRQLLTTANDIPVRDILVRDVQTVPVDMDQEQIADIVQDYDVTSVAVIDDAGALLGRIMVDDILDVIEEEATEDVARMAGTAPEDVYSRSFVRTFRARFPWLLGTFGGGLLIVGLILALEDDLIADLPILAAAIPIIMGMAGNVGTQAATVTVRGLAIGEIDYASIGRVIGKEVAAGSVFAICFGALLYPLLHLIAWLSGEGIPSGMDPVTAMCVPAIAMTLTIAFASATGTLVPLALHKLGKDPAVASAPFITTAVDVVAISLLAVVKIALIR